MKGCGFFKVNMDKDLGDEIKTLEACKTAIGMTCCTGWRNGIQLKD